jgi:hypothetical protein
LPSMTGTSTAAHARGHHDGRAAHHASQCRNYEKQIKPDKPAVIGKKTAVDRALVINANFS